MTMLPKKKEQKEITMIEDSLPPPNLMMFYEFEQKFVFEKNHELLKDLQGKIQIFLQNENNYFDLHKHFLEKNLKDLHYLKDYQKSISEKEENYRRLLENYQIMSERIANQDSMIKQIENSYLDKIDDLKTEISNLTELLSKTEEEKQQITEKMNNENDALTQKLEKEIEVTFKKHKIYLFMYLELKKIIRVSQDNCTRK